MDYIDYIIITRTGEGLTFSDENTDIVVYNDRDEAASDYFEDLDLGIAELHYSNIGDNTCTSVRFNGSEIGEFVHRFKDNDDFQRKLKDFIALHDFEREDLRHKLSAHLMHSSEDQPVKVDVTIGEDSEENVGLSSLLLPNVIGAFQDSEGIIWFVIYGADDPMEFDRIDTCDIREILNFIENS